MKEKRIGMLKNIFLVACRRKITLLLFVLSSILFGLWCWVYLVLQDDQSLHTLNTVKDSEDNKVSNYHQLHILQKLIAQANQVLSVHNRDDNVNKQFIKGNRAKNTINQSILKNPTNTNGVVLVEEASAKTISLVTRRKQKAPIIGESFLFEEERLKILENQQRARNSAMDDIQMLDEDNRLLNSNERQQQYEHELQRMGVPIIPGINPENPKAKPPKERLVHLDLKGAPPKISFLKQLLPLLKTLGATGLLVEYEDMFPFENHLINASAKNAYTRYELKDFLETCALHDLSVMPLIQTFGHLEYVLKLEEYANLRELPQSAQSICPSKPESMTLLQDLLTQLIEFHLQFKHRATTALQITHIHIGCDEVYRMAMCELCCFKVKHQLFLDHVTAIANFIRHRWPELRVTIWDDMLRSMSLTKLQLSLIGNYVEPMIWVYHTDIYGAAPPNLWQRYAEVFPTAWVASAFKGAFGESLVIPPIQRHLENNLRWLAVLNEEGGRFSKGFQGIALTGWQRYDHFAVLCELLPVGIPSLITSLSTISTGYFNTNIKENILLKALQCHFHPESRRSGHPWIVFSNNSHHSQLFSTCTYLGSAIYQFALHLSERLTEIQIYIQQIESRSAWLSLYNIRHNFSSTLIVQENNRDAINYINDLIELSKQAYQLLSDIYDEYTTAEFIEQHIYPSIAALQRQFNNGSELLNAVYWPRRPLPISRELLALNIMPNVNETQNSQGQTMDK